LLSRCDIDLGKLALPELQRPFVWPKTKVRDLLDIEGSGDGRQDHD
jgi:hypothetical protein